MKSREERERIARAVRQFKRGRDRERSFRLLFDHYYGVVQGFFAQRVSTPEDRLDLTQETFLRVYKGLEGYRMEADFGTWLFRIAFNTHLKWLRSLRSRRPASMDPRGPLGRSLRPGTAENLSWFAAADAAGRYAPA